MESFQITDVSLLTVIIGAVLAFSWGFVYFSDRLFVKQFRQVHNIAADAKPPAKAMVYEAINLLLLSWFVSLLYSLQMEHAMLRGIGLLFGLIMISGFFSETAWLQKGMKAACLSTGYFIGIIVILVLTNHLGRML